MKYNWNLNLKFHHNLGLVSTIGLTILITTTLISSSPASPTSVSTTSWENTLLPDWNQITFAKMPAIQKSGSFEVADNVAFQLGYNPNRSWNVGENPDSFMMLGDFQTSFKLQNFSLVDIDRILKSNPDEEENSDDESDILEKITLNKVGVIKFQTLESLVKAIPNLKEIPITSVKPILDLLTPVVPNSLDLNQSIGRLMGRSPHFGKLEFSSLNLESYTVDSIPGLSTTPIGAFEKWQGTYINEIPGLPKVPFSKFPNPVNSVGASVGIVDVAFGTSEQKRDRTISGSNKEGFAVECNKDCAHVELSGSPAISGKAWISGKYQLVRGGKGILASVNGGKEPTGRHPFGEAFKVAVWDVSEVDGMMSQSLFFRFCTRNKFVDFGCTPYFIGPVPFMSYKEKQPIFLGVIDDSGKKNSVSTPTGLKSNGFTFNNSPITSGNSLSSLIPTVKGDCNNKHSSGINIDALSNAFPNIEENYNYVGNFVCDTNNNCGRGLGIMQFMSYRPDVRRIIISKDGGSKFIKKIDSGEKVSSEEMLQYFSPTEQQFLMKSQTNQLLAAASQQIDPNNGKTFTDKSLIKRVAEINFGGVAIPTGKNITDVSDTVSLKEYAVKTVNKYFDNLQSMQCQ